jgi:hypothetical protein
MNKRTLVGLMLVLLAATGLAVSCGPRQPAAGPLPAGCRADQA